MKYIKWFLSTFLLFFSFNTSIAQKDSSNIKNDSINSEILYNFKKKNIELQQKLFIDSIKSVQLIAQINALKTTDNLKKEKLLKQLESINSEKQTKFIEKKAKIDSLRLVAKSFPVHGFFNDTLFSIYSKLGGFTAHERANAIEKRIKKLPSLFQFSADSIKIIPSDIFVDLAVGETILISISDDDALWNNTTKNALAENYKKIISNAIIKYNTEVSTTSLTKNIGLSILILFIVGLAIFYINKLFRWTNSKIIEQKDKQIKGIKLKNYTLFDSNRLVSILQSVNTIFKWLVILFLIYITLPVLFGFFPWTESLAKTLFGYIINPVKDIFRGLWNYLPDLITIIVIVTIFRFTLKGIRFFKNEIENQKLNIPGFYPDWANPTFQIIRIIIIAFMIIVIFPYLPGSDSKVFQGVSVFLGFLFTFGSAGSLSNIMAGLVLTYMRLFKIGDRVKFGDVLGDVIEKSILVTRVRTIKNEIISIPNSTILNSHTINYSSDTVENGLIIHTTVTIGYDVPWKDMHQALINAADRTPMLLKEPKPFVLQTSLDDFYVSYEINAFTKDANKQARIYSDLHANIQDCCNEVGIEIMSPHYKAARDGNKTTIPENYLDKNYKTPSFNIKNTDD